MLYASAGDEEHILYECLDPGETLVSKGASKVITFCDVQRFPLMTCASEAIWGVESTASGSAIPFPGCCRDLRDAM